MDELVAKARQKQPGLIVVDRAVHGKNQNYLTPENTVPEKAILDPWESCIISGGGWSYTPDATFKSGREIVHMLIDIVAKGGNLLLNIAPSPEGTWQTDAYDRLEKIGAWLQVNGEAIYATRPIEPYAADQVRFTQHKDGTVFAIYLASEQEGSLPASVDIPWADGRRIESVSILGASSAISWKEDRASIHIEIPTAIREHPPCHYAWAFRIEM
jgi:alpha-L-fucosidase